ncbi:MAG TPA: HAD family hydrolase [Verrucomicrobiae bacterium]|nr:HAD family hydrolase [Verrucomicrobiae bacterium]
MKRAVFLDRDGTINIDKEYLSDPARLELIPGAGPALRRLMDAGFLLVIVTNQSGIGRGLYTLADMEAVNLRLRLELAKDGVRFEKIYAAPEHPDQPSRGRKPRPQFLFDARDEFGIDLSQSYMIGDKLIDLQCGWNAGVKKSILVRTGYGAETEQQSKDKLGPAVVADSLAEAVEWILQAEPASGERPPVPSTLWRRLNALMATQIEIQPKVSLHKEWHLYVAGDGVHTARAGTFAKFIPWSEVESVRAHRIKGRHGDPIELPMTNRHILLQIRDEWHKYYPEACATDRRRARREFLLITFVALPVFLILVMMFSFYSSEVERNGSFGEAARVVLFTKLHWAILLGLGLSALIWVPLWFGRSLREHGSRPHETRTPDNEL